MASLPLASFATFLSVALIPFLCSICCSAFCSLCFLLPCPVHSLEPRSISRGSKWGTRSSPRKSVLVRVLFQHAVSPSFSYSSQVHNATVPCAKTLHEFYILPSVWCFFGLMIMAEEAQLCLPFPSLPSSFKESPCLLGLQWNI